MEADTTYQAIYITEQGVSQYWVNSLERLKITAIDAMKKYLAQLSPIAYELMGKFTII